LSLLQLQLQAPTLPQSSSLLEPETGAQILG
jgi:hypothetical protein